VRLAGTLLAREPLRRMVRIAEADQKVLVDERGFEPPAFSLRTRNKIHKGAVLQPLTSSEGHLKWATWATGTRTRLAAQVFAYTRFSNTSVKHTITFMPQEFPGLKPNDDRRMRRARLIRDGVSWRQACLQSG
jgi:hypothetical protein